MRPHKAANFWGLQNLINKFFSDIWSTTGSQCSHALSAHCKQLGCVSTEAITMSPNFSTHNPTVIEHFGLEVVCTCSLSKKMTQKWPGLVRGSSLSFSKNSTPVQEHSITVYTVRACGPRVTGPKWSPLLFWQIKCGLGTATDEFA